jgi:hypothetical protein
VLPDKGVSCQSIAESLPLRKAAPDVILDVIWGAGVVLLDGAAGTKVILAEIRADRRAMRSEITAG